MLAPLNSTMIAVALPSIMAEFHVGMGRAAWLVTIYLATMASLQPLAGKLGDRVGCRRLVLGGLVLFGLASLASAVAPRLWVLILCRALQGIAAACIVPNGAALVREVLPEEQRGRGFGYIATAVAIAAAAGPPLGGALIALAGWRAIFLVNVIVVLPSLLMGWQQLPASRATTTGHRFDIAGAIMLPVCLIAAAGLLMLLGRGATPVVMVTGSLVVCMMAIVFIQHENRHPDPVIKFGLFRHRAFAAANSGIGLSNLAMYTLLLSVPLLLVARGGFSSFQTGLVLTALSASMVALTPYGGRLVDRCGRRIPTVLGLLMLTLGTLPIAHAGIDIALPTLLIGLTCVGFGVGLSTSGLQTTAVECVPREEAGMASGIYSTSRYLGSILGSAILGTLLGAERSEVYNLGLVFVIVFIAALLAMIASLGLQAYPSVDAGA